MLGGFLAAAVLPAFNISQAYAANETGTPSAVIISEIKLGGTSYSHGTDQPKDPQEFITLYNQSDSEVNLTGWTLEYAKPTFDKTYCADSDWMSRDTNSSVSLTELSGLLQPHQVSTPVVRSMTDNAAGSLRLVNRSGVTSPIVEDMVGWGETSSCSEGSPATVPQSGKSLKRYLDCQLSTPVDTNNNQADFATDQPPSPATLSSPLLAGCQENSEDNDPPASEQTCEGIVISELLPNPAGTDTDHEFIELYNPTGAAISLRGCSLQTTSGSKAFNFSNITLQPKEYHAFYDNESGLILPNSAGGTVWLLSPVDELQAITYPANLDDDVAWALSDSGWQATYKPTPDAANIVESSKPCPEGEVRNPDTGYCHSSATLTTSNLSICPAGKVRNPDTNRCRSVISSESGLVPCKAGQIRNPDTNRCRAALSLASASLKPCAAGQERNPTTHRCRKAASASASNLATVKDVASGSISGSTHWLLAGLAVAGATSYGVYEWRQEILQFIGRVKTKLLPDSSK